MIIKQQRTCFETGVLYNLITLRQLLPIHTYTHVSIHPYIDTRPRELFMHSTTTPLTHSISNTLRRLSFHHLVPINLVVHTSIYQHCHLDISPASNSKYSVKEVRCGGLSGTWHCIFRYPPISVIRPKHHVHSTSVTNAT